MNLKLLFTAFFLSVGFNLISAQENYKTLVFKGNQQFDKQDYESSSSKYLEAVQLDDKEFMAHYNLGNSLYKRKMFDEAKAEFEKAEKLSANLPDKSAALYNLGNTFMKQENSKKAAELYKQALKQDPYNESIRKNYEIDGKDPNENKKSNDNKIPKDLEDAILNRVGNKERETAKRILNKNSYSMPESNEKDW